MVGTSIEKRLLKKHVCFKKQTNRRRNKWKIKLSRFCFPWSSWPWKQDSTSRLISQGSFVLSHFQSRQKLLTDDVSYRFCRLMMLPENKSPMDHYGRKYMRCLAHCIIEGWERVTWFVCTLINLFLALLPFSQLSS